MKKLFVLLITCFTSFSVMAHIPTEQAYRKNSLAPMLKKVMPTIVNISVEKVTMRSLNQLMPAPDNNDTKIPVKSMAVGSGVIFNAAHGYIVTNAHVVKNQKVIIVTLKNGMRYQAKMLAKDKDYDIAILQIHAKHLTQLPFANADKLQVGDFVTAIGSPFGLSETVTSGVVSALNRSHPQIEGFQSFIQTDAPINPGNSGGALVNMAGKLVGINTAIVAPSMGNAGIGFAIPSNMAHNVITQLLKYGKVERGALGVIVQDLTPALADTMGLQHQKGAIVSEVLPNTPAADAGLKTADLIIKIDDQHINGSVSLKNTLGLIRPDTAINLTILRDKQHLIIPATVGDPKGLKTQSTPYFSGTRLQDFSELESDGKKLTGVIVASVKETSPGAIAGLQPGDVITAINRAPTPSLKKIKKAISNHTKPLLLTVTREHMQLFLALRAH